jgi:hypothetical protein
MATRRVERWILALLVTLHPALAAAQASHVSLVIDGRGVTLDARDAPLRDILAEWSRVGGTKVMNAETLDPRPVTISLSGVGERQALDILLRDIGGYILSARKADDHTASQFAGLVVVAARAAAVTSVSRPAPFAARPAFVLSEPSPEVEAADTAPEPVAAPPQLRPRTSARGTPGGSESSDAAGEPVPGGAVEPAAPRRLPLTTTGAPDASRPSGGAAGAARPGEIVQAPVPSGLTMTDPSVKGTVRQGSQP